MDDKARKRWYSANKYEIRQLRKNADPVNPVNWIEIICQVKPHKRMPPEERLKGLLRKYLRGGIIDRLVL